MIVPTWVYAAAGLTAVALGFAGGWTVRDWKRDSEVLKEVSTAAKKLDDARKTVDTAADAYEKDRQNAQVVERAGNQVIRDTYRERVVPGDCAVAAPAVGVLNDAISAANARAAGQPAAAVPTDRGAP